MWVSCGQCLMEIERRMSANKLYLTLFRYMLPGRPIANVTFKWFVNYLRCYILKSAQCMMTQFS
jgi:hypothetical protein